MMVYFYLFYESHAYLVGMMLVDLLEVVPVMTTTSIELLGRSANSEAAISSVTSQPPSLPSSETPIVSKSRVNDTELDLANDEYANYHSPPSSQASNDIAALLMQLHGSVLVVQESDHAV